KDTTRCLYMIGTKGGEARKIQSHATDIQGYSWKADGTRIAFLATEPLAKDTKARQDQGFTQEIYEEDQPFVRVWLRHMDGGAGPEMLKLSGSASEMHFNPKENKIAVALAPTPGIDDHIMFRKVHIVDLGTGKATNLNNPGKLGQLAWSPDGKKLAMITGADKHDPREGRAWLHEGGPDWKDITPDSKKGGSLHVESIAWKDNGALLVQYASGTRTTTYMWRESSGGTRIRNGGPLPTNLTVSRDGETMALIGQKPTHPPEVYYAGKDTNGTLRLTDSNPWLKDMKFAKQEVVKYKARDGLELEGILIRPLNEEKGKRYPLVLT